MNLAPKPAPGEVYRHQNDSLYLVLFVGVWDQSADACADAHPAIPGGEDMAEGVLYVGLDDGKQQKHFRRLWDHDQGWCVPKNGRPRFEKI